MDGEIITCWTNSLRLLVIEYLKLRICANRKFGEMTFGIQWREYSPFYKEE